MRGKWSGTTFSNKLNATQRVFEFCFKNHIVRKGIEMVSLPSHSFKSEKLIANYCNNLSLDAVEINTPVFYKMVNKGKNIKNIKVSNSYNTKLLNYLQIASKKYDILYSDWMGTFSLEKIKEVKVSFQRNLLKNRCLLLYVIATNHGWGRAQEVLNFSRKYNTNPIITINKGSCLEKNKIAGFIGLVKHFAENYGFHVIKCACKKYIGQGRSPQVVIGLSLIRSKKEDMRINSDYQEKGANMKLIHL